MNKILCPKEKISFLVDESVLSHLNEYTVFFKDGHLGVRRPIWSDTKESNLQSEIMNISTYGKNLYINVDSLQQATKN
jgi:hypothetical protein